jgi:hypothetical protein
VTLEVASETVAVPALPGWSTVQVTLVWVWTDADGVEVYQFPYPERDVGTLEQAHRLFLGGQEGSALYEVRRLFGDHGEGPLAGYHVKGKELAFLEGTRHLFVVGGPT